MVGRVGAPQLHGHVDHAPLAPFGAWPNSTCSASSIRPRETLCSGGSASMWSSSPKRPNGCFLSLRPSLGSLTGNHPRHRSLRARRAGASSTAQGAAKAYRNVRSGSPPIVLGAPPEAPRSRRVGAGPARQAAASLYSDGSCVTSVTLLWPPETRPKQLAYIYGRCATRSQRPQRPSASS